MRTLGAKLKALEAARPLSELLPWMLSLTDGVLINKDGALMSCYAFRGMDTRGRADSEPEAGAEAVRRALDTSSDGRLMLWWTVERTRMHGYPKGTFTNPVAGRLDGEYRQACERERWYVNRRYLSVVQSPESAMAGALKRAAREGMAAGAGGLIRWAREKWSGEGRFETDVADLLGRLTEHREMTDSLLSAFPPLGWKRLERERLLGFLNALASPSVGYHPVFADPDGMYLDDALGEDALSVLSGRLWFRGAARSAYVAALTVKPLPAAWPAATWPGILDCVTDVDAEAVLSVAMRMMDHEQAKQYVVGRRRHHLNWRKGLMGYVKEGVFHVETENVDSGAQVLADDANAALEDMAYSPSGGWLNVTLLLKSETEEGLECAVSEASRALQQAGFAPLRERLHLLSSWAGTLPGQWSEPVRWVYASGASMADLAPLRGEATGNPVNRHLTEQLGEPVSALAVLATRSRTPCYFGPQVGDGDVGHTFILGPTGAGKTVFGNFLCLEWGKFPAARVIVFDKDRSCRILTGLLGGEALDAAKGLKVNPCTGLRDERDWKWFAGWVSRLLSARGEPLTAGQEGEVVEAIGHMRSAGAARLGALAAMLPTALRERLAPWIGSGRWAGFFDREEDAFDFSVSNRMTVEMGTLMRFPEAARAFMDLAFWRIDRAMTGAPTLIYIEEVWFLLEDEGFAGRLEDWLRTFRKKNGVVMMATQSLAELSRSRAFPVIAGGVPNRFLLANPDVKAFAAVYRDQLGLTDRQIDLIVGLQPKREYLYLAGGRTRVVAPRFPPYLLAALRSDSKVQERFDLWSGSGSRDWEDGYLKEVAGNA